MAFAGSASMERVKNHSAIAPETGQNEIVPGTRGTLDWASKHMSPWGLRSHLKLYQPAENSVNALSPRKHAERKNSKIIFRADRAIMETGKAATKSALQEIHESTKFYSICNIDAYSKMDVSWLGCDSLGAETIRQKNTRSREIRANEGWGQLPLRNEYIYGQ
ncbi:MAG TPA: hypothetical protein VN670_06830 [Acidobacteriaceae bacterium]|nr:hypothetical protein [Acidobacteriaceae bacterium]